MRRAAALLISLAPVTAACDGGDAEPTTTTAPATRTVKAAGGFDGYRPLDVCRGRSVTVVGRGARA